LLHPPVQKLACFLVVELGDHGVDEVYEVCPAPGAPGAQLTYAGFEVGQFGLVEVWLVLDDAEVLEAGQVQGLAVGIEFLEVLFSGGVTGEEVYGPLVLGLEFVLGVPRPAVGSGKHALRQLARDAPSPRYAAGFTLRSLTRNTYNSGKRV